MNAPTIEHDLALRISEIRDLSVLVGRGAFDSCDAQLLRQLRDVTGELYTALGITRTLLAS